MREETTQTSQKTQQPLLDLWACGCDSNTYFPIYLPLNGWVLPSSSSTPSTSCFSQQKSRQSQSQPGMPPLHLISHYSTIPHPSFTLQEQLFTIPPNSVLNVKRLNNFFFCNFYINYTSNKRLDISKCKQTNILSNNFK